LQEKSVIHVLMLPEFLPRDLGWGSFSWNYIKSASLTCKVTVFHSRINNDTKGKMIQQENDVDVIRYYANHSKPSGFNKILEYIKWFVTSLKIMRTDIENVDIIHAHGTVLSGSLAYFYSRKNNIPFVITEHTGPFSKVISNPLKKLWTKFIMEKANAILCVSAHAKEQILTSGITPRKTEIIFNPIDTTLFQKVEKKMLTKNMIFVGRFDQNKGALRALIAFHQFNKTNPDWTLTIVGNGKERKQLLQFIEENDLHQHVILKGFLSPKLLAEEFNNADFLISPTLHETFGLVIAEAMACGLPVITTNKTAPKELVGDDCGILIDPNNKEELLLSIQAMEKTIKNYDSNLIRDKIVNRCSVSNFGKRLFTIYQSL
jgi:L-malate glycosyltransferase